MQENSLSLEARLQESANNLDKINVNTGLLGKGMTGIRSEINQINGGLQNVRESVNLTKTQVENQLITIQSEWGERIDLRFRQVQTELNGQVEEITGTLTSQMAVVNQQVESVREELNLAREVARVAENNLRDKVREIIELELEKANIRPMVPTDQLRRGGPVTDVFVIPRGETV